MEQTSGTHPNGDLVAIAADLAEALRFGRGYQDAAERRRAALRRYERWLRGQRHARPSKDRLRVSPEARAAWQQAAAEGR